uniref:Uncharacterized protein n=1 Tax=Avena sativa TaxID=4498 RepID=A0ACD5Z1L6_AVESA
MAKAQVAVRFVTEVAPPQLVSIMRRRHKAPRSGGLDTIAEDDRELQLAYGDHQAATTAAAAAPSARTFTAASLKRVSPTTGGFMRELSSCFSGNVVHAQAGGGGWEGRHKGHARQAVYAHHGQNQMHAKLKN